MKYTCSLVLSRVGRRQIGTNGQELVHGVAQDEPAGSKLSLVNLGCTLADLLVRLTRLPQPVQRFSGLTAEEGAGSTGHPGRSSNV